MFKLSKILLVDDDEVTNFINQTILEELNIAHQVDVLTNGQAALDYLMGHCRSATGYCPALVILDHHMPVMDGLEFMEAFNALDLAHKEDIIFLVLAGSARSQDIRKFKELGAHEFTFKPLSKEWVMEAYHKYWGETSKRH